MGSERICRGVHQGPVSISCRWSLDGSEGVVRGGDWCVPLSMRDTVGSGTLPKAKVPIVLVDAVGSPLPPSPPYPALLRLCPGDDRQKTSEAPPASVSPLPSHFHGSKTRTTPPFEPVSPSPPPLPALSSSPSPPLPPLIWQPHHSSTPANSTGSAPPHSDQSDDLDKAYPPIEAHRVRDASSERTDNGCRGGRAGFGPRRHRSGCLCLGYLCCGLERGGGRMGWCCWCWWWKTFWLWLWLWLCLL